MALALAGVVALLFAAEIAARFAVPVSEAVARRTPWQAARVLGWAHRPSATVAWPPGSGHQVKTNAAGFAGEEFPKTRSLDTFRIVVLGDDLVEASAVEYSRTFAALLEQKLNAGALSGGIRRAEVLNCGVAGYSALQQFLLGNSKGRNLFAELKPNLVVSVLSLPNDLLESDEKLDSGETVAPVGPLVNRPYIVISRGTVAKVEPVYHALRADTPWGVLWNYSSLLNLAWPHPGLRAVPRMAPSRTVAALYRPELSARFAAAEDLLLTLLREMQHDAASHKAGLLVALAPDRPEILNGRAWQQALEREGGEPGIDPDIVEKRLENRAGAERIDLFSLTAHLRQAICERQLGWGAGGYGLFMPELPQLSPLGHQIVAAALADELRSRYPAIFGAAPRTFADNYHRTVPGVFVGGEPSALLMAKTTFTVALEVPTMPRAARALIDNTTSIHAGHSYYVPGASGECAPFGGIAFAVDPAELTPGQHRIDVEVLTAANETIRMEPPLELVTGLHFGQIEQPPPGAVVTEPLIVSGWAVSLRGVAAVEVLLGDELLGSASCSVERPDLAAQLSAALADTAPGFTLTVPALQLEPGEHMLRLRLVTQDGERVEIGEPVPVTVPL